MLTDIDYQPSRTALIVIDMQNDYVHRDGAVIRYFREKHGSEAGKNGPTHAETIIPALINLIEAARKAGVMVVWVRTLQTPWTETDYWQTRWKQPDGFAPGWGLELYEGLHPKAEEPEVIKHRHSCFFATDMDLILRGSGINTVLMTGVGTPYCVEGSIRDAFARDYKVITISDGTATREMEEHLAALKRFSTAFGYVMDSASIIEKWG